MNLLKRRRADNAVRAFAPYNPLATKEDIFYCFRLILGRNPQSEEWRGHSSRSGSELAPIVATYLNSREFAQRGLHRVPEDELPTKTSIHGYDMYAFESDEDVGRPILHGVYEPNVTAVFRQHVKPGMRVLDIGANIGYFTMLAASLVGKDGHVHAIEPNARNTKLIEASRRANQFTNVTIHQVAAGSSEGLLALNYTYSNGTTADPSADLGALIGSNTVPSLRVDTLLAPGDEVDFIKIDIEGAEYRALAGAARVIERSRPVIVSEFSPNAMPGFSGVTGVEYLQFLISKGYQLAVILPDGGVQPCGQDHQKVMEAFAASGVDHIDILATPRSH